MIKVFKYAITLLNTIKPSVVNTLLLRRSCKKMDSNRNNPLHHTEMRWFSKEQVLKQVLELRIELIRFYRARKEDVVKFLHDDTLSLAYLVSNSYKLNLTFLCKEETKLSSI